MGVPEHRTPVGVRCAFPAEPTPCLPRASFPHPFPGGTPAPLRSVRLPYRYSRTATPVLLRPYGYLVQPLRPDASVTQALA